MWCCSVHRRTHLQCFSFSALPPGWMELAHWCSPGPVLLRCCKPGSSCNGTQVFCLKAHTNRPIVHPTFFLTKIKHSYVLSSVLVPDTTLSKFVLSFIYFPTASFSRSIRTSSDRKHTYTNGKVCYGIFISIYFQRDATLHSSLISGKLLYMFRYLLTSRNM